MRRVLVLGCSGSGKSTVAMELGRLTGLEVIHLDAYFWKAGWVETPQVEWRVVVDELIRRDSWIMDGGYTGTLDARLEVADTVIFLDFPRWLCIWRVIKRRIVNHGRTRPDMAEGCPEKVDLEFILFVWRHKHRSRPGIIARLERQRDRKQIHTFRRQSEVRRYFRDLASRNDLVTRVEANCGG
jgi:adenylate kinase family enzyme